MLFWEANLFCHIANSISEQIKLACTETIGEEKRGTNSYTIIAFYKQ